MCMFWWSSKREVKQLKEKTENSFSAVKKDMDAVSKWIKHLDSQNKQLFDMVSAVEKDLSSLSDEITSLREGVDLVLNVQKNKQLFKKLPVLDKQTPVENVQRVVQTAVQTGSIHNILKDFSSNERLLMLTLLNSDMKLSYEDIALLLGKERSTIRGQINAIKQKAEGLILEVVEKNGKKRVYVPEEVRLKMQKYAKVRGKQEGEER